MSNILVPINEKERKLQIYASWFMTIIINFSQIKSCFYWSEHAEQDNSLSLCFKI